MTTEGIIVSLDDLKKTFNRQQFLQLLEKLTIKTPQKIGKDKIAKLYKWGTQNNARVIHLPRSMLRLFATNKMFRLKIILPKLDHIEVEFKGKLDANQTAIVDYLCEEYYSQNAVVEGRGSTTLQLTAGYGKTFIGIGLIARLRLRTLVIVPANSDLSSQWIKCCNEYLTTNTTAYSNAKNIISEINVIMITTAIKKPPEWFHQFGLIIYDEIHMFCSPVWGEIFWRTNVSHVLGLTATPDDRKDQFDEVFKRHVGAVCYARDIPGFELQEINFKGIVDVVGYHGSEEYTIHEENPATGKLDAGKLVKLINSDPERNDLIVREVERLYNLHNDPTEITLGNSHPDKPLSIYVFCSFREHVRVIVDMLRKCNLKAEAPEIDNDNAPQVKIMMGSMKRKDIEEAKRARITVTTFKFSGTGISVVEKTAILFASPLKSNFKQIVARILRKGSDYNVVRRITDIVDKETALQYQYRERAKAYQLYGFCCRFR